MIIKFYRTREEYGHCSCYDTWTALNGGGISDYYDSGDENPPDREFSTRWSGTKAQLLKLIKKKTDPEYEDRIASPEDYDYDHLMKVYDQIEKYFERHPTLR